MIPEPQNQLSLRALGSHQAQITDLAIYGEGSTIQNHLPPFIGKIVTIAFNLGLIVLVLRFIVNPMILHFGDDDRRAWAHPDMPR